MKNIEQLAEEIIERCQPIFNEASDMDGIYIEEDPLLKEDIIKMLKTII